MSSTDLWKALCDRVKAKEQANSCPKVSASVGGGVDVDTDGGSPQPPGLFSGSVVGGGVWSYLFPEERQHRISEADVVAGGGSGADMEAHAKVAKTCNGEISDQIEGCSMSCACVMRGRLSDIGSECELI